MGLRDNLRKAAGLFVEMPSEAPAEAEMTADLAGPPPARTVEHIVRDTAGPNLDEIQVPAEKAAAVATADGSVNFGELYQRAGLPAAPFTAEQMLDMLTSLPADLPLEAKRQTVKATMNAMGKAIGATAETIVTDASRKVAALSAYVDAMTRQSADFTARSEMEIATLQAQIAEKRKAIDTAKGQLQRVTATCNAEAERLDDVLEFFSLDVPPSKYAEQQAVKGNTK